MPTLPRKRSDRLRLTGWIILAAGVVSSIVFYVLASRAADAALDDATALGYQRAFQHGMGQMMGSTGMILTDWRQTLTTPLAEALMIAAGVALFAGYFFRVAWVIDHS